MTDGLSLRSVQIHSTLPEMRLHRLPLCRIPSELLRGRASEQGPHRYLKSALAFLAALLSVASIAFSADDQPAIAAGQIDTGVGSVDITPTEPVTLAGSPSPKRAAEVKTRLFVRALVLSGSGKRVAIVTLDTLKYPVELAVRARAKIEQDTGIPASNVIICASHTHFGPLWSYYEDQLVTRSPRPWRGRREMWHRARLEPRKAKRKGSANAGV
ncbi:hypothetical protein [Chthoniobacter flavus]|nr:hypothetical protein [Chthoniobacter flavus]